ncbi:hypothetical protein [Streptomyces albidoflavus]|uniref:hypothetical protein n=1 Tax=Streptomyces albidoflavus TaxID=1886 RepID=UPI00102246C6|nr:hypothetical protein [Streptomyces albidoflavus]
MIAHDATSLCRGCGGVGSGSARLCVELGELLGCEVEQIHQAPLREASRGGQGAVDARVEGADGIQSGGAGDNQAQLGLKPGPLLDGGRRGVFIDLAEGGRS